ncbi:unnamed protein product [Adineta steineri]|uniref:EF-hand domain-containing protein n=1 Tax=Adineta steineri TaxID=433720 RepID=A0A814ZZW7_9BILA|nr:unnamed protein product [Adineta steineri]CAF1250747.1 unnamed protein product [Adineta steineri]CAF1310500.1 unnamed protein product [Adineta steineri]CAF1536347.1 unnamed protein product [Adineta steineri]CAF3959226.1 unnamed protein product [Adineta steineri]
MGQHSSILSTQLAEFVWRRKFGDRPFENLVKKYPGRLHQLIYDADKDRTDNVELEDFMKIVDDLLNQEKDDDDDDDDFLLVL